MRVLGRETRGQNESEMGGRMVEEIWPCLHHQPVLQPGGLSKSIYDGTRKTVN